MKTQGQGGAEPSLAKFDETIARYRQVVDDINAVPPVAVISWIRIDAKPIKGMAVVI